MMFKKACEEMAVTVCLTCKVCTRDLSGQFPTELDISS